MKGQASAAKRGERGGRRGRRVELHPRRRQDRRAGGGRLRDRLRGPHRASSRSSPARWRCTSPRPNPLYVSEEDVAEEAKEAELRVLREQAAAEGKPENVQEKIVEGRLKQVARGGRPARPEARERGQARAARRSSELRTEIAASTGENVVIRRFARFQVGEE